MHAPHHRRHSRQIRIAHGRPRGQTQPIPKECLGPPTPQSWGKHIPLPQNWGPGGRDGGQGVAIEREDFPFALHSFI